MSDELRNATVHIQSSKPIMEKRGRVESLSQLKTAVYGTYRRIERNIIVYGMVSGGMGDEQCLGRGTSLYLLT